LSNATSKRSRVHVADPKELFIGGSWVSPSAPAAPFGGFKSSGIGRELGREGVDGFVELRSISVA